MVQLTTVPSALGRPPIPLVLPFPKNLFLQSGKLIFILFAFFLSEISSQDCNGATTTVPSIRATTLVPGVQAPLAASSHWCRPLQSPFNINNPATWPLSENDPSGVDIRKLTSFHLDPLSNPALADYIVRKHNCRRTQVNPSASNMLQMIWSQDAAVLAQKWGLKCLVNEHDPGNPTTSDNIPCNQNLISSFPIPISWNSAIDGWFEEWSMFVYADPAMLDLYHEIGHYTMMVWAKSFYLGCAWVNCSGTHNYICNQCPSGNAGDLSVPYERGSSCSKCPNNCDGGLCIKHCLFQNSYSNCDALDQTYRICSDPDFASYGASCPATCKCQGAVF